MLITSQGPLPTPGPLSLLEPLPSLDPTATAAAALSTVATPVSWDGSDLRSPTIWIWPRAPGGFDTPVFQET